MSPEDYAVPSDYTAARHADPAEDHIGPFFVRAADGATDVAVTSAMRATALHCNSMGVVHGGVLMTFADFTMSEAALHGGEPGEHCLTVSFDAQFVASARDGELLQGEAQIIRKSRTLTFVRGLIHTQRDRIRVELLAFSGVGKRVLADPKNPSPPAPA